MTRSQEPDFAAFEVEARRLGYDEVLERRWEPGTVLPTHTHPFAVAARVVQGEMWLRVGEVCQHLHPGEHFMLDADVPHDERYGPEGATYWVARRILR
jgi:hypothetical protein